MGVLYFILACVAIFVGGWIWSKFFDCNGNRLPFAEPFWNDEDRKRYWINVDNFLSPYASCDFAKEAMTGAKRHISHAYEEYKKGTDYPTYYQDMFGSNKNHGVYRGWAIVYLHYFLHRRIYTPSVMPGEAEIFAKKSLTTQIDELYSKLAADGTICPQSFFDFFIE